MTFRIPAYTPTHWITKRALLVIRVLLSLLCVSLSVLSSVTKISGHASKALNVGLGQRCRCAISDSSSIQCEPHAMLYDHSLNSYISLNRQPRDDPWTALPLFESEGKGLSSYQMDADKSSLVTALCHIMSRAMRGDIAHVLTTY